MNQVKLNYRQGPGICVFQLHKGSSGITWHFLPDSFYMNAVISSSKYPRNNIQNLLAVEDLGRGSSGKVWMTMTNSNNPAICVLKFRNYQRHENQLETEKEWWHLLYPEFRSLVHVENWSGSLALRMPHFSSIPTERRDDFREQIHTLLREKFANERYVHEDVRWRNLGIYRGSDGVEVPVLYDLETVPFSISKRRDSNCRNNGHWSTNS
jgi:hypothetical protein